MELHTWLLVVLLVAVVAWYLSFSASRLDRLHHRVEGARSALDAQLVRRAEAALELATSGALDPASGLLVAGAAAEALAAGEADVDGEPADGREQSESDLSRALQAALDDDVVTTLQAHEVGRRLVDRLAAVCHRVQLARRFHNDAVTDAARVRGKRIVRWARLAGRAPLPQTFEMDDDPPAALAQRPPARAT
ncbi:MAG TPA: hypothetical protein VFL94_14460 [Actinomycetales bacterium]|nr:hypothetical protein [Actinomycetales bacterium]